MHKKIGVPEETPTETCFDNRHDRYSCQAGTEEPLLFTLPNDQVGDVKVPGVIAGASVQPLPLEVGHSDHKVQQVWRDNTHAVYQHRCSHGQFIGWEAILIKVAPAARVFGKGLPGPGGLSRQ